MKSLRILTTATVIGLLGGCTFDGGPVVISDTDHKVNMGGQLTDSEPLAVLVREKIKNNGQTMLSNILVSSPEPDTVRLSGLVDNDGIRQEAERLAYQVSGVRFVINTLNIRR